MASVALEELSFENVNGQMDNWTDGQMDGQTDGRWTKSDCFYQKSMLATTAASLKIYFELLLWNWKSSWLETLLKGFWWLVDQN